MFDRCVRGVRYGAIEKSLKRLYCSPPFPNTGCMVGIVTETPLVTAESVVETCDSRDGSFILSFRIGFSCAFTGRVNSPLRKSKSRVNFGFIVHAFFFQK